MNGSYCPMCDEPLTVGEDITRMNPDQPAHRECLLRAVVGGIGHLEDHPHWCLTMHDPDGGRSYRQSALEVDRWIHEGRDLRGERR